MSPPNLNRSCQYRLIPSIHEVKGPYVPPINILLHYLALSPLARQFIYSLDALQSELRYTFP